MKEILIITDTYEDINGVTTTIKQLEKNSSCKITVIHPGLFETFSCPLYKGLKMVFPSQTYFERFMTTTFPGDDFDYIHIATEGPLGLMAKKWCEKNGYKYNTSFHTNWADYFKIYWCIPKSLTWKYLRWFHKGSSNVFVASKVMKNFLYLNGFDDKKMEIMPRGIDHDLFVPEENRVVFKNDIVYPIDVLYVGRVSTEKNIEDVLNLHKIMYNVNVHVVGDGPILSELRRKYNVEGVYFHGFLEGQQLVSMYQMADVTVFPSMTDTYGLIQIESMACGTPVVGKKSLLSNVVIKEGSNGYIYDCPSELSAKVLQAVMLDRAKVVETVEDYSWKEVTSTWEKNLVER
jgi:glycosyltransferase involved in cell wall biosynthesis